MQFVVCDLELESAFDTANAAQWAGWQERGPSHTSVGDILMEAAAWSWGSPRKDSRAHAPLGAANTQLGPLYFVVFAAWARWRQRGEDTLMTSQEPDGRQCTRCCWWTRMSELVTSKQALRALHQFLLAGGWLLLSVSTEAAPRGGACVCKSGASTMATDGRVDHPVVFVDIFLAAARQERSATIVRSCSVEEKKRGAAADAKNMDADKMEQAMAKTVRMAAEVAAPSPARPIKEWILDVTREKIRDPSGFLLWFTPPNALRLPGALARAKRNQLRHTWQTWREEDQSGRIHLRRWLEHFGRDTCPGGRGGQRQGSVEASAVIVRA